MLEPHIRAVLIVLGMCCPWEDEQEARDHGVFVWTKFHFKFLSELEGRKGGWLGLDFSQESVHPQGAFDLWKKYQKKLEALQLFSSTFSDDANSKLITTYNDYPAEGGDQMAVDLSVLFSAAGHCQLGQLVESQAEDLRRDPTTRVIVQYCSQLYSEQEANAALAQLHVKIRLTHPHIEIDNLLAIAEVVRSMRTPGQCRVVINLLPLGYIAVTNEVERMQLSEIYAELKKLFKAEVFPLEAQSFVIIDEEQQKTLAELFPKQYEINIDDLSSKLPEGKVRLDLRALAIHVGQKESTPDIITRLGLSEFYLFILLDQDEDRNFEANHLSIGYLALTKKIAGLVPASLARTKLFEQVGVVPKKLETSRLATNSPGPSVQSGSVK